MKVVAFIQSINIGSVKFQSAFWAGKSEGTPAPKEHDRYVPDVGVKPDTFPVKRSDLFRKNIDKAYLAKVKERPVWLTIEEGLITLVEDV
jgi:hypothetical protein